MSITSPTPPHPLLAAVRAAGMTLDETAGVDPLYLSVREKKALLVELTGLVARVTALRADVLAVADDLADETADHSPGTWLAAEARVERREAVADHRLGVVLRKRWSAVAAAARAGSITWEQAGVITRALDELPGDLDPELLTKAEAHLVTEAGQFGPVPLRRLGRKVLEVIAPDLADDHEAKALAAEERRAHGATRLSLRPCGDGTTDLHARLPTPVANRLKTYLDAYTSPRQHPAPAALGGEVDRLPLGHRRGLAFCAVLEHLPQDGLPRHGGTPTQVLVMIDLDTLTSDLTAAGVAETSTGDTLTAGQARRLACTAGILPVVLDGKSQILDLGRSKRLFSGPARLALDARDRRCRADRCDIPAAWCEAHHATTPWPKAAAPTSPTASSSAPIIIIGPTTPPTAPTASPTATSASTSARDSPGPLPGRRRRSTLYL